MKSKRISFRLSNDEYVALIKKAKDENMKLSDIIRLAIRKFLNEAST
ncbi:MAG: ribbon-helix-helix protein, CopG family [Candidatus Nezhaarchaeales archaeon]